MSDINLRSLIGHERSCYVCNKGFIIYPDWVYKRGTGDGIKVFCSYHCMRSYEGNNMTKAQKNEALRKMLSEGKSIREIVDALDIESRRVYYWKHKMEKEGLL